MKTQTEGKKVKKCKLELYDYTSQGWKLSKSSLKKSNNSSIAIISTPLVLQQLQSPIWFWDKTNPLNSLSAKQFLHTNCIELF